MSWWNNNSKQRDSSTDGSKHLLLALNSAQTAIVTVDKKLNVSFVNEKALELLSMHRDIFRAWNTNFQARREWLIGQNIDIFHTDFSEHNGSLNDLSNRKYEAEITAKGANIHLAITAFNDEKGEHVGNVLEFDDVTEHRQQEAERARLQTAIDQSLTALAMVNRDFEITYINQQTLRLFEKHASAFQTIWSDFTADPDWLMGRCIENLYADPQHQYTLMSDPNNLPHCTDITIDGLVIELNMSAIVDANGDYIGNGLEWRDVTDIRSQERKAGRLVSAVEGMTTNIMMADRNGIIKYSNPALTTMFRHRERELQSLFQGFNADKLDGVNIDVFFKNSTHQHDTYSDPARMPFTSHIAIGGLEFDVTCIAMHDAGGSYLGPALQWEDVTEQNAGQRDVQRLITDASKGVLDSRIDTENYSGFMANLGGAINGLISSIVEPLNQCQSVMSKVAEGDLKVEMPDNYQGDFKQLSNAVNRSIINLREMVGKITDSTTKVASASNEIAEGNSDLSERTEEQASSLEETAASMEEMTATVKQNAEGAEAANKLSEDASKKAQKGGDVVSQAVSAMGEINQASKKIADIISVIDEIAFQTNLLALNAAVEAARAGEQGRGFAVVAGEVRSLAQRSAGAAKEIKDLIKDSVEKVSEGSRLVDESGDVLNQIVDAVGEVSALISNINSASQEQATGIDEISKAIEKMDEMTQQNAALVEQATASSQSLREEGKELLNLISFFRVDEAKAAIRTPSVRKQKTEEPAQRSSLRKQEARETVRTSSARKQESKETVRTSSARKQESKETIRTSSERKKATKEPIRTPSIRKKDTEAKKRKSVEEKTVTGRDKPAKENKPVISERRKRSKERAEAARRKSAAKRVANSDLVIGNTDPDDEWEEF
ncbi:methyl-accepting chemotaxis protein [Veronia pacifica]|uniref:Chemotaxis protein n=1 Tax=Veronia pacifica TaxID=1080227 RepID=A0A1C3EIX4_9GAMM|nr:methyl-accepting chemotaxis protein [Veronia pacifica]ODA33178.1 chemotaxis protein [Veronia pacifica]